VGKDYARFFFEAFLFPFFAAFFLFFAILVFVRPTTGKTCTKLIF